MKGPETGRGRSQLALPFESAVTLCDGTQRPPGRRRSLVSRGDEVPRPAASLLPHLGRWRRRRPRSRTPAGFRHRRACVTGSILRQPPNSAPPPTAVRAAQYSPPGGGTLDASYSHHGRTGARAFPSSPPPRPPRSFPARKLPTLIGSLNKFYSVALMPIILNFVLDN